MAVSQKLALKQNQSLVMTPQLQQAIKLLQFSNADLVGYIESELERNPLLERDDGNQENPVTHTAGGQTEQPDVPVPTTESVAAANEAAPQQNDGAEANASSSDSPESNFESEAIGELGESWDGADSADVEVGASVAFENWGGSGKGGSQSFDNDFDFESNLVSEVSLRDHLASQINIALTEPADRLIASQMVELLDETGYLKGDLDQLADKLSVSPDHIEGVLRTLQKLDPPGIFARSLPECMKIQLEDLGELDIEMEIVVDNLDILATGDWAKVQRLAELNEDELREKLQILRSLQPRPTLAFQTDAVHAVTPDVILRPAPAGGWIVELNSENLPRVLINNAYASRVQSGKMHEKDKDFLNESLQSANWLVKALHQRATTILKVSTTIVQMQEDFFAKGVQYLRPLVLRDVADRLSIHESTVSRVTNNKFLQTPRGLYELKYFFTAAIASSDGKESHSAEAVRFRIKSLIDGEEVGKIYSDDRLVQILRQEGVDIARRTVAKYRESMRIPSSVQRRRLKAMR